MKPIPLTARKAGAVLAALMLSTALTACQPQASAASTTPPTSAPTPTAPASGSSDGSQSDIPRGLENFYSQSIDWQDCPDGAPFKCGTVTVPLDYEHPDGRTITIALKKLPASDGNAEYGSLFTNPGGPGASGIETVKDPAAMPEELRGAYDIIGFDPRGVGQSTPITCWTDDEIKQSLTAPDDGSTNPMKPLKGVTSKNVPAQDKIDRGAANAARCAQHSEVPELLDHVGTRNVARDLDILRATNGNTKLNYLGTSYGTHIGAIYADLFPGHVGRTVLNAAMDPSRHRTDSDAEVVAFKEGALRQYVEHCRTQNGCPLTGSTDEAIAQLTTFVDGLDKNPLTAPGSNVTVNTENATAIVQQYAVEKPDWEALTAMLTPAMNERDGTLMVKAKQSVPDLSPNTTVEEAVSSANSEVMFGAVICNDYPDTGGTASDWDAQAAAEKKSYPFFGGTSNAMEAYCRGWGHRGQTPPQEETHAKGSAPILVIGTTGDSRTLYPWAQSLTDQLDNGHLLTVKGYGHGASGSCAGAAMIDFLVNGTVPAEGTTCDAGPQQAAGGAEG